MKTRLLFPLFVGSVLLSGCTETESVGLANPAAAFCSDSGHRYEIRDDGAGGQSGVCILASGEEVDAWTYFRENAPD